jgi:hypothetical protein
VTAGQINEFYERRVAMVATGEEAPCAGCNRKLEAKENFSIYALKVKPAPLRGMPDAFILCQACTYNVIGAKMA